MSENATRAEGAPYPIDLATLPRPSRTLLKLLTSLPTWTAEGWAHPSDEHLRAAGEYSDKRPIKRARKPLVTLGLVVHREVRKGELLPNGERARFRHWIYVAGPALRPSNDGGGEPLPEEGGENGAEAVPERLGGGPFWSPRSVDPEDRNKKVRSSAPPEPLTHSANEERTLSFSVGSTETPPPPRSLSAPEVATEVLACQVARHWIAATGVGWKTVRNDVIEYLTPFLDEMNGDAPSRVARACHVIDLVVREHLAAGNKPPSLRFIFHREIFWRRLDALSNPDAKPLTKAARRPVEAPKLEKAPGVAKRPRSSPPIDNGPRVDAETMRRDLERLFSEMDRPASSPAATNSATLQGEKQEEPGVTIVADDLGASAVLATISGTAGGRVDLAEELAEELAKLRAAPAAPSSERGGDLAKELAEELAKLGASSPATDEEHQGIATTIAVDELEACAELAETESVRRAVWERETKELEEREEDAERMKRARWGERGELADDEDRKLRPGVRSTMAKSSEGWQRAA
jgi:hypothetical protein